MKLLTNIANMRGTMAAYRRRAVQQPDKDDLAREQLPLTVQVRETRTRAAPSAKMRSNLRTIMPTIAGLAVLVLVSVTVAVARLGRRPPPVSNRAASDVDGPSSAIPLGGSLPKDEAEDGGGDERDDLYDYYDAPFVDSDPTPPLRRRDVDAVAAHHERKKAEVNRRLRLARDGSFAEDDGGARVAAPFECPKRSDAEGPDSELKERYGSVDSWEESGGWHIPSVDFASMVMQLVRALPPEAKFLDGDEIFDSAVGGGQFLSALTGAAAAAEGGRPLRLSLYGSDILPRSVDLAQGAVFPRGRFCVADSQNISFAPSDRFDWTVAGYVEPLDGASGGTDPERQERWFRWWVHNMARITKPGGWMIVAFVYRPGRGTDGMGIGQTKFWRRAEQLRLWQVWPQSVRMIRVNDEWPKRPHVKDRYHVLMQRNDRSFGAEPCSHVTAKAGTDPDYEHCRYTGMDVTYYMPLDDFTVAGMNLANYVQGSKQNSHLSQAPTTAFELFQDFDISHLITGNEDWWQLLEHRQTLRIPNLSFYVDKVAHKRWLLSMGFDVPRPLVLKYADDLKAAGNILEEVDEILGLIPPNATDYVAKPTHTSMVRGVGLVSHDPDRDAPRICFHKESTAPLDDFSQRDLAHHLVEYLHAEAWEHESSALRRVRPGVLVEERFTLWDRDDLPSLEFRVFCIWGRAWISQWRRGDRRLGLIHRNGTMVNCEEKAAEKLPRWLDWPRVMNIAEWLAGSKDMLRVDVFVGIPAGSPSLRPEAAEDERLSALRYAVSETEIHPIADDMPQEVFDEAAKLWIAGYKIGNYRVIENTEIPETFIQSNLNNAVRDLF